jgi:hypothetical protein
MKTAAANALDAAFAYVDTCGVYGPPVVPVTPDNDNENRTPDPLDGDEDPDENIVP